jgi:hypothetical protein
MAMNTGELGGAQDQRLKVAWRAAAEELLQRHGWCAVDHAEGVLRPDVTDPVYVWWKPPGYGFRYSVRLIISPNDNEGCEWLIIGGSCAWVGETVAELAAHIARIVRHCACANCKEESSDV